MEIKRLSRSIIVSIFLFTYYIIRNSTPNNEHCSCRQKLRACGNYWKICVLSLTYNHHLNQSYAADVALEPIIWIVDNYAHFLGRVSKHSELGCKCGKGRRTCKSTHTRHKNDLA